MSVGGPHRANGSRVIQGHADVEPGRLPHAVLGAGRDGRDGLRRPRLRAGPEDLLRCGKRPGLINPVINEGGAGEMVERRDWNGQLLWRFSYNSPTHRMHHDVEPMPNGNVLIIAWELKTMAEAAAAGRDTSGFADNSVWPDHIIEVEPVGLDSGTIVWEWHAWDHLVQDHDDTKDNFGVIADNPYYNSLISSVTRIIM